MGTVASGKDGERDESETSGYSDLRDIASALGIEDDDASAVEADAAEIDDLEPIGTGYGGASAAALISDATIETPAANSPRAEATSGTRPPPPPPPKAPTIAPVVAAPVEPAAPVAEAKPATTPPPVPPPRRATPVPAAVSLAAPAVAPVIPPASSSVAAAPVVAPRAAVAQEPERRKGGMIWVAAAGAVAVAGVLWFTMRDQNKPAPAVAVAPAVDPEAAARAAAEREAAARAAAEREAAERAAAEKAAAEAAAAEAAAKAAADAAAAEAAAKAEADAAAAAAAAAAADAKVEVSVSQRKKGPKAEPVAEDEPKAAPSKPEPLTPQEIDEKFRAECVLNPSKPGCDEIRKRQRNNADLDGNLSDKLTQQQIREGFGKVKGKAKACGGDPGVTVRVKVSIAGDSGNVMSAEALDDHAGTALGNCVAKALEGASFSRFTSSQQGTVYPVAF